jgi:hypothetical protein
MRNFTLLFTLVLLLSCSKSADFHTLSVRQKIHHDDFEYSVSSYVVTNYLRSGKDTLYAHGMFYLVNFRVDNNAKRANHSWNNRIAYIIDGKGGVYENIPSIQQYFLKSRKFNLKENYVTPAGTSDSTYLAFDLPFTVTKPCLMVRGQVLMGDIFDRLKFRRMLIELF